ncbi:Alpha/Beta hydrolase protein [Cunninghamella echinulata]|nr:Alpha/Beta hydrolase protein [Cunninghamella echinulata]
MKYLIAALFTLINASTLLVSSLPVDNTNGGVFESKLYPNLKVNFKTPDLCDPTVKQYSGYIDVTENDHYFFWFFESRQQPEKDPLTIWLNGGPGSTSMLGLWTELGPCRVNGDASQALYNEVGSWNKVSNLLFVDQPSEVGFSYGTRNITNTEDGAQYMYIFLQIFYEAFPQYKPNDFHFFGESYGGRYVPTYADYIVQQNKLKHANHFEIPLKSIGVGNGVMDPLIQNQYYQKMACNSTYGPVVTEDLCETMRLNTPICTQLTEKCYETDDDQDCITAFTYCSFSVQYMYFLSGKSPYDVRSSKPVDESYIGFINKTSTLEAIGARPQFNGLNDKVLAAFGTTGDRIKSSASHVTNLLNNDIPVLMYAGDADFICTHYGIQAWVEQLEFENSQEFRNGKLKPWSMNGKDAGLIQQGGGLTYLRIYEAGHLVPTDQPEAALKMFTDHLQLNLK